MRFNLVAILLTVAAIALLSLDACDASVCTRNSDCTAGLVCGEESTCIVPPDMTEVDFGADMTTVDQSVGDLGSADFADGFNADATTD